MAHFSDSSGSVGKQFQTIFTCRNRAFETCPERKMSESNLAYNNDGSMNTSADYLGKVFCDDPWFDFWSGPDRLGLK